MKWLTKTEIAERAKKSYKEAILVSIEHHQQIAKATRREFFEGVGSGKVSISSDHCGICRREDKCRDCFLTNGRGGCGSDWKRIHIAIDEILVGKIDGSAGLWPVVVKAENRMIERLRKELRKLK